MSDSSQRYAAVPLPFFSNLNRPSSPNNYLIAPDWFQGEPDERAPILAASARQLGDALEKIIGELRTAREVKRNGALICFVDETRLLHFKDDVHFQVIEMGPLLSTLAAYSASRVGYWDFGANKERMRKLIAKMPFKTEVSLTLPAPEPF